MATITTVQDTYNQVSSTLLEPSENGTKPGLSLGIVTLDQFLQLFATVLLDFIQKSGLTCTIFTQQINPNQPQYLIPPDIAQLQECFVSGRYINRVELWDLDNARWNWRNVNDNPELWHEDGLPIKTIEVYPNPVFPGIAYSNPAFLTQEPPWGIYGTFAPLDNNLTMVGTQSVLVNSWTLGDIIPVIPDSFCFYISYGVLNRIFSSDSEAKDEQRAMYTGARYAEGLALAKSVSGQESEGN